MNAAHLHLILNHFPVLIIVLSLALIVWGVLAKKPDITRVSLIGFVLAGLLVIPVFLSGNSAEEIVESIPGIRESVINQHEEFAEITVWVTLVMAVMSLVGLFIERRFRMFFKKYTLILVLFGIITGGFLGYTGYLGGHIRHPEITGQQTAQNQPMRTNNHDSNLKNE